MPGTSFDDSSYARRLCTICVFTLWTLAYDVQRIKCNSSAAKVLEPTIYHQQRIFKSIMLQEPIIRVCAWHRPLNVGATIPSSRGYRWDDRKGHLRLDWMEQQPAPEALLHPLTCKCKV